MQLGIDQGFWVFWVTKRRRDPRCYLGFSGFGSWGKNDTQARETPLAIGPSPCPADRFACAGELTTEVLDPHRISFGWFVRCFGSSPCFRNCLTDKCLLLSFFLSQNFSPGFPYSRMSRRSVGIGFCLVHPRLSSWEMSLTRAVAVRSVVHRLSASFGGFQNRRRAASLAVPGGHRFF